MTAKTAKKIKLVIVRAFCAMGFSAFTYREVHGSFKGFFIIHNTTVYYI